MTMEDWVPTIMAETWAKPELKTKLLTTYKSGHRSANKITKMAMNNLTSTGQKGKTNEAQRSSITLLRPALA